MSKSFITGFARIGEQRELKFALESYWANKSDFNAVKSVAEQLRIRHLNYQKNAGIDYISVGDFSYYDIMLDHCIAFGAIPKRFSGLSGEELYFSMARGNKNAVAMEMTKWFNTNYHYIVPELSKDTKFSLDSSKYEAEYKEAKTLGIKPKINLIGPFTYLALSKTTDNSDAFSLLDSLVSVYCELVAKLSKLDDEVVIELDEPIFVTDKALLLVDKLKSVYDKICASANNAKIIFMTFFEHANEAVKEIVKTPVWAVGLDAVHNTSCHGGSIKAINESGKVLFAGLINGRNIWIADLQALSQKIEHLAEKIPNERLYIGTSCSLLHVPYSLKYETDLKIKRWLSYGVEKLDEVAILTAIANKATLSPKQIELLNANKQAIAARKSSELINDEAVKTRVKSLTTFERQTPYSERIKAQHNEFKLPVLPTTTIGSFPQTPELRATRNAFKKARLAKMNTKQKLKFI